MSVAAKVSRIPFRARDEAMIADMAGWMKFLGIVTIVAGVIAVLTTVLLASVLGAVLAAAADRPAELVARAREGAQEAAARTEARQGGTLTTGQRESFERIERALPNLPAFLRRNQWSLYGLPVAGLILAGLSISSGYFLHSAGDELRQVARTDLADQDLMASGLTKVSTYFKLVVANAVITALVSTVAIVSFAAQLGLLSQTSR
jgi:type II secretory pathway pseudopilin PulG